MNLSDYGAMLYTQIVVGLASAPATMYIALALEEPTLSGAASDLVEPVDGTGYMRKSIATADWQLVSADTPAVTNINSYTWTAAVNWDPINYIVLCTSVGVDQVYAWAEVDPLTTLAGVQYVLAEESLVLSVGGPSDRID